MKREEIEQLLAGYVSGEISAQHRQQLEELFGQDAALKKEADEMLSAWRLIDRMGESEQPGNDMDDQFYAMLQRAQTDQRMNGRVVTINKTWLQVAAAILICITAFGMGRFTAPPSTPVFKYKTVYTKQPVVVQSSTPVAAPAKRHDIVLATDKPPVREKAEATEDVELIQQLRSIYASERIDAVTKIGAKHELSDNDLKNLELALKEDPSPNVRLMILDALRPIIAKQNVQAVLINALDNQDDGMIRSSMVEMLISVRSQQAIPQMIALLNDKSTDPVTQNKIKVNIQSFLN